MLNRDVLASLTTLLGRSRVLTSLPQRERYSADALSPSRAYRSAQLLNSTADVVVRPKNTQQVAEIVKLAVQHRIPIIPYGGGTGVMGGVVPLKGGIAIDLQGLNKVLNIDPISLTATVESGVILADLAHVLEGQGLLLAHDPWSLPIATVGGAISTNGVGYRAAAYGPMGDHVLGLEVVLPDGELLTTRAVPKYSTGPNLNQLFIGSEGAFGIITKATIKILRQPEERIFSTFRFQKFDQGFQAITELLAIGLVPSVLDLTEDFEGVHLYLIFEGYKEGVDAQRRRSKLVCEAAGGIDNGPTEATIYWDTRYRIAEGYRDEVASLTRRQRWKRHSRSFDYLHVALPLDKVPSYRKKCDAIFKKYDIRCSEYGIWARPELFSMLLLPGDVTKEEDMPKAVDMVLTLAQDMGGVMEYCHGVGIKLAHLLAREMDVSLDVLGNMKCSLDPHNIMNPGKLGLDKA
ncbi:MAG: FAD-binding oxidoreductase [SAR202 cluster bacterium]|nr:FAD-binding oxidoreductase [SAR202 cluster bacterium]